MGKAKSAISTARSNQLFDDVLTSIEAVHGTISHSAPANLVTLYWRIGQRIAEEMESVRIKRNREHVISTLAVRLRQEEIAQFSREALMQMMQFSQCFTDYITIITFSKHLTWEHFQVLIAIEDEMRRDFYTWMCFSKKWSTRVLQSKIKGSLYEKTPAKKRSSEEYYDEMLTTELTQLNAGLLSWLGLNF